jgi:hypothetical protein
MKLDTKGIALQAAEKPSTKGTASVVVLEKP